MNFLGLEGKGIDDWARQEDCVKPVPSHLQSLSQVPETGDATFRFDEFAAGCCSLTTAL
jgi:hypothetical protein